MNQRSDIDAYKKKKEFAGKVVYFSHPVFCFRTKTEKICLSILKKLGAKRIINPADYGLKDDLTKILDKADVLVGMAISRKFTHLVWNELERGKSRGAKVYTFYVESKDDIGPLVEGIPNDVDALSLQETKIFTNSILSGDYRESVFSLFVGNFGRRF